MNSEIYLQGKKSIIFNQLKQFAAEIIGAEIIEELNISYDSVFTKDLEMGSIEIVAFAEKVNAFYGKDIDFISCLYGMNINKLINLSLGTIVDLIYEKIENKS